MSPLQLARHEAGHAVIALAMGVRVVRVNAVLETVSEDDVLPGQVACTTEFHGSDINRFGNRLFAGRATLDEVVGMMCVLLAGSVAQGDGIGAASDRGKAEAIALTYCRNDKRSTKSLLVFARRRTTALVRQHRAKIVKVARALRTRDTLSGAELLRVLRVRRRTSSTSNT